MQTHENPKRPNFAKGSTANFGGKRSEMKVFFVNIRTSCFVKWFADIDILTSKRILKWNEHFLFQSRFETLAVVCFYIASRQLGDNFETIQGQVWLGKTLGQLQDNFEITFGQLWDVFGTVEQLLDDSWATLRQLWASLRQFWDNLKTLLDHLGSLSSYLTTAGAFGLH